MQTPEDQPDCIEDFINHFNCHCGSPLCRGLITDHDWQLPELQKRYQGHFSPHINDRILTISRACDFF